MSLKDMAMMLLNGSPEMQKLAQGIQPEGLARFGLGDLSSQLSALAPAARRPMDSPAGAYAHPSMQVLFGR